MSLRAAFRSAAISAKMVQTNLKLGPKEAAVMRGLRYGFDGTHGPYWNAPGEKSRVRGCTGPGATFRFASQREGADAFIGFAANEGNRNHRFTNHPIYGRLGTPLTEDVETRVVGAVGGKFSEVEAVSVATGQAANVLALKMFSSNGVDSGLEARRVSEGNPIPTELLGRGRHGILIQGGGMYGCSFDHIRELAERDGKDVHILDLTDLTRVRETLKANPHIKVIFCEALNNPNVTLLDIQALAKLRNEINEKNGYEGEDRVKLVVDLTFTTTQVRPFEWDRSLWPDAVTLSGTKMIAGGSHMAGFLIAPREHITGKRGALYLRKDTGAIMADPVAEDLIVSGLPTIIPRAKLNSYYAALFANAFAGDDRVTIFHPSLPSHPQYDLARRIMSNHDGEFDASNILRVRLNPPRFASPHIIESLPAQVILGIAAPESFEFRVWPGMYYAVSLGNDWSLVSQPVSTTQAVMALINSPVLPEILDCGPMDLRLSIGWLHGLRSIEHFKYAVDRAYRNLRS